MMGDPKAWKMELVDGQLTSVPADETNTSPETLALLKQLRREQAEASGGRDEDYICPTCGFDYLDNGVDHCSDPRHGAAPEEAGEPPREFKNLMQTLYDATVAEANEATEANRTAQYNAYHEVKKFVARLSRERDELRRSVILAENVVDVAALAWQNYGAMLDNETRAMDALKEALIEYCERMTEDSGV